MKTVKLNAMEISAQIVDVDEHKQLLENAYELIGCDWVESVRAVNLKEPYVLVVDEEGLVKDRPVLNLIASILYGALKHGQPIAGDAIVMKEVWTEDGIDLEWLTDEEAKEAFELIREEMEGTPFAIA